jgi:hypothetical protein
MYIYDEQNEKYTDDILTVKMTVGTSEDAKNVFEIIYVPSEKEKTNPTEQYIWPDKPRFIDLGLPSGTLWCDRNYYTPNNNAKFEQYGWKSNGYSMSDTNVIDSNEEMIKHVVSTNGNSEVLFPYSKNLSDLKCDISGSKYDGVYSYIYDMYPDTANEHLTSNAVVGFEFQNKTLPKDSYLRTPSYSQYKELIDYTDIETYEMKIRTDSQDDEANELFENDSPKTVNVYKLTSKINGESILMYDFNICIGSELYGTAITRGFILIGAIGLLCTIVGTSIFSPDRPRENVRIISAMNEYTNKFRTSTASIQDRPAYISKRIDCNITNVDTDLNFRSVANVIDKDSEVKEIMSMKRDIYVGSDARNLKSLSNTSFVFEITKNEDRKLSIMPNEMYFPADIEYDYTQTTGQINALTNDGQSDYYEIPYPIRPVVSKDIPVIRYISTHMKYYNKRIFEVYVYETEKNIHTNKSQTITEVGVCFNSNLNVRYPSIDNSNTIIFTSNHQNPNQRFVMGTNLLHVTFPSSSKKYNVRFYAKNDVGGIIYTQTITVDLSESLSDGPNYIDGYELVDLGLPSGTLWATHNLGKNDNVLNSNYRNANSHGIELNDSETCKLPHGVTHKWCVDNVNGVVIGQYYEEQPTSENIQNTIYDNCRIHLGYPWITPSQKNFNELIQNCNISVGRDDTTYQKKNQKNGSWETVCVKYIEFTSKINDAKIFLPLSDCWEQNMFGNWKDNNIETTYWTSIPDASAPKNAHRFRFELTDGDAHVNINDHYTSDGNPTLTDNIWGAGSVTTHRFIRPIMDKSELSKFVE